MFTMIKTKEMQWLCVLMVAVLLQLPGAAYSSDPHLIAWWKFDETQGPTATDATGNGHTGTMINSPAIVTGRMGNALQFNGSNNYVSWTDNNNSLDLTNEVSVEAWCKPNSSAGLQTIVSKGGYSYLLATSGGRAYFIAGSGSQSGWNVIVLGATALNSANWYHIVGTYKCGVGRVYVNGVLDGTNIGQDTLMQTNNSPQVIGTYGSYYFNGIIDNVRIYDRELSDINVYRRYLDGDIVGQWRFDDGGTTNTTVDSSAYANDGTLSGVTLPTWLSASSAYAGSSALQFSGAGYVSCPDSSNLDLATGITVEAWVKPDTSNGIHVIACKGAYTYFLATYNGRAIFFEGGDEASGWNVGVYGTTVLNSANWYHIVGTYDAATGEGYLYVNGVLDGTGTGTALAIPTNAYTLSIGSASSYTTNYYFNGTIDEVTIYRKALTASEIGWLYGNLAGITYGRSLYVSTSGSDDIITHDGLSPSTSHAWRSISYAAAQANQAGDTVNVLGGTYNNEQVLLGCSGTPGCPITFQSYGNQSVTLNGNHNTAHGFYTSTTAQANYIRIKNMHILYYSDDGIALGVNYIDSNQQQHHIQQHDITISNCEIDNCNNTNYSRGSGIFANCSNLWILDCKTHDNFAAGILVSATPDCPANHVTIERCQAYNNNHRGGIWVEMLPIYYHTSDEVNYSDLNKYITISNCDVHDNGSQGMQIYDTAYTLLKNNHCYNNLFTGINTEYCNRRIILDGNLLEMNSTGAGSEGGGWMSGTWYGIMQNNICRYNHNGGIIMQNQDVIVRWNQFYSNKAQNDHRDDATKLPYNSAGLLIVCNNPNNPASIDDTVNCAIVHNTIYDNGVVATPPPAYNCLQAGGVVVQDYFNKDHNNVFKNNIVADNTGKFAVNWYVCNGSGSLDFFTTMDYNDYYSSVLTFCWQGNDKTFAAWQAACGMDAYSISSEPLFVSPVVATSGWITWNDNLFNHGLPTASNLTIPVNSPCANTGTNLTTATSAGSDSKYLTVADARYFSDGCKMMLGDMIAIGAATNTARVIAVDYTNKILTLSKPMSWSTGDGVNYPFNGSAPAIGYYDPQQ